MSRSHRHIPKCHYSHAKAHSEKPWKRIWHRKLRALARSNMARFGPDEVLLPHERSAFSDFDFGRSGRRWFNPQAEPHLMRK